MSIKQIVPSELHSLFERDETIQVIDVRTIEEFEDIRCAYAKNIPLDSFDPTSVFGNEGIDANKDTYIICRSGKRSQSAAELCVAAGFTKVINVEGGTLEWVANGLPTKNG